MEIPPGPRKLRYFLNLLIGAVFLYVIGNILSEFYGFTFLENVIAPFIENPMALFNLAGILSLIVLAVIGWNYLSDF
ncbi:hypothetical protein [Halobacterium salinarum]|uniref:hypothetical protein n=1 Tax=Halobacterium salinarum TaxID=2242 RepID=UPI002553DBB5|nr:hypothetical protein [Halobacterium salinarum]MDL0145941.1 hypothetical protein [Halobacterium salinarum]